ncbi:unnamed protein product [Pleuronectes platessa]|uniref:Uncharacterized protein n=1 Tax=Pleuronectes platessa TaxID=8262 RepID=A0A9N7Y9D0_PLEPL|nr:unnamed protein product [Pleuronectes platessa]
MMPAIVQFSAAPSSQKKTRHTHCQSFNLKIKIDHEERGSDEKVGFEEKIRTGEIRLLLSAMQEERLDILPPSVGLKKETEDGEKWPYIARDLTGHGVQSDQ